MNAACEEGTPTQVTKTTPFGPSAMSVSYSNEDAADWETTGSLPLLLVLLVLVLLAPLVLLALPVLLAPLVLLALKSAPPPAPLPPAPPLTVVPW